MYLFMYVTDEPVYISAMYLIAQAKCSVNPRIPGGMPGGDFPKRGKGGRKGGNHAR